MERLFSSLIVSVLAHGVFLAGGLCLTCGGGESPAAPVLEISLADVGVVPVEPPPAPPVPVVPQPEPPVPALVSPPSAPPVKAAETPTPPPPTVQAESPVTVPVPPPPKPEPVCPRVTAMSAAPAVRPSVPAVAAVPAAPALAAANAGPSAEIGAADYSQITARLRQNIAYPYRARQQGMEGKVLVAFLLKADGSVADVRVEESSGHKLLDKDAVATVRKAAPFTSLGRDYVLKCPISYSLR